MELRRLLRDRRERAEEKAERGKLGRWRRSVVEPAAGLVLDVGVGMGFDLPHFRNATAVVGIDWDLEYLRRARKRLAGSPVKSWLVAADAQAMPFRAETFDSAVATLVFCTIPRPELALAEVRRVVRPERAVRMLEHVRFKNPIAGKLQDLITPLGKRLADGCHQNRDTVGAAKRSGLVVEAVRPHLRGYMLEIDARVPAGM
ncbi:MAG: class I SAM-dependent methyltransferase, partial [Gemmatimonadetes bacterium]|nr:class I SAM-dependent methyltransferase [Gemmatimonadota bacterium]